MKNEIFYSGYEIYWTCGYYWIRDFKTPFQSLKEAKDYIDFIEEEAMYMQ